MANTIEQYAKLHAALVQEKKDLEGRLSDIDKALAGKLTPAKKKAAKKKNNIYAIDFELWGISILPFECILV